MILYRLNKARIARYNIAMENRITAIAPIPVNTLANGATKLAAAVVTNIRAKPARIAAKYNNATLFIQYPSFIYYMEIEGMEIVQIT